MKTEIGLAAGMTQEAIDSFGANMPMLDSADISNAVIYVLGTKPHVQVIKRQKIILVTLALNYDCFRCMNLLSNR